MAALEPVTQRSGEHRVLHVFCPRDVAARPLRDCRDCPSCMGLDTGEDGNTPAVLCGHGSSA